MNRGAQITVHRLKSRYAGESCCDSMFSTVRLSRPDLCVLSFPPLYFLPLLFLSLYSFLKLCAFEWPSIGSWEVVLLHKAHIPKVPPKEELSGKGVGCFEKKMCLLFVFCLFPAIGRFYLQGAVFPCFFCLCLGDSWWKLVETQHLAPRKRCFLEFF